MAKKKYSPKQPLIRSKSAKLITGILLLVVLSVGAVVAVALTREPQDNSSQAKYAECGWCGRNCTFVSDDMRCLDIAHDDGVCTNKEDGYGCEVISQEEATKRGVTNSKPQNIKINPKISPIKLEIKTQDKEMAQEKTRLTADFDNNGKVDNNDLSFLRKRFFKSDADALKADLNGDKRVNFQDYAIVRSHMGK